MLDNNEIHRAKIGFAVMNAAVYDRHHCQSTIVTSQLISYTPYQRHKAIISLDRLGNFPPAVLAKKQVKGIGVAVPCLMEIDQHRPPLWYHTDGYMSQSVFSGSTT